MTMLAYHSSPAVKRKILTQLRAHAKADQLVKGQYWENGKGCAVGCTVHSGEHAKYEPLFGIPRVLARLEDRIFEGLPNKDAQRWPVQFMSAIKPGAYLSDIWPQFAIWLLADPVAGVIRFAKTDAQRAAIDGVAELYRQRVPQGDPKWALARKDASAYAYAYAVASASAAAAADAYADADAYAATADASASASASAAAAADAADTAADTAAAYAADAYAAAAYARSIHWEACAAKMLELLRAA